MIFIAPDIAWVQSGPKWSKVVQSCPKCLRVPWGSWEFLGVSWFPWGFSSFLGFLGVPQDSSGFLGFHGIFLVFIKVYQVTQDILRGHLNRM